MIQKILTIDEQVRFCQEKNLTTFSAKQYGRSLCVSIPSTFEVTEGSEYEGLLKAKIRVAHTGLNRNGSYITEESMKKAMPGLKYRPVLAYIHQLKDGSYDFWGHNIEYSEDGDGNAQVEYLEKQVGSFTADEPFLEYDAERDKTYVVAYAVIPETYTKAAEIIRRKGGTKVSCELMVNSMSYDAKNKYLNLEDFVFYGLTLLGADEEGTQIQEGMAGAKLDIADFACEPKYAVNEEIVNILERLNTALSRFHIDNSTKGGNPTVDMNENAPVIENEEQEMSEETTEVEAVEEETETEAPEVEINESEEEFNEESEGEAVEEETEEEEVAPVVEEEMAEETENEDEAAENEEFEEVEEENQVYTRTYSLSHEDVRCALYELLDAAREDGDYYPWIDAVYDDHVIFEMGYEFFGWKYAQDGDNISLVGDKYKVYAEWLTESEKNTLDAMRANYSALTKEVEKYRVAEVNSEKYALAQSSDYNGIRTVAEFNELVNGIGTDKDNTNTVEEFKEKCDAILLANAKKGALEFVEAPKAGVEMHQFSIPSDKKKRSRYGSLKFN